MKKPRKIALHNKNDALEKILQSRERIMKQLQLQHVTQIYSSGDKVLYIENPTLDAICEGIILDDTATHITIKKLDGSIVKVSPFAVLPFPKIV